MPLLRPRGPRPAVTVADRADRVSAGAHAGHAGLAPGEGVGPGTGTGNDPE